MVGKSITTGGDSGGSVEECGEPEAKAVLRAKLQQTMNVQNATMDVGLGL